MKESLADASQYFSNQRRRNLVARLAAFGLAVFLFSALLLFAGRNPFTILAAIFDGAFGSRLAILETLTRATPLLLCAIAVAIPARAGLFNIGGEGQLHVGAVAATAVALNAGQLGPWLIIPAMLLAAALAGGTWAAIPGLLKGRLGVNEVLVGLMLNYVAIFLVQHLVHGPWKDDSALGWPYSASFPAAATLPTLGNSNVHLGLLIGIALAVLCFLLLRHTIWGFSVRIIDSSPRTARYLGLPLALYVLILMVLGGACAAFAGAGEVSVIQGRLRPGISPGYGYTGFIVAWLAGHNFLAIIPVAILIGALYSGADALQLTAGLPSAATDIFMGLVFLAFILSSYLTDRAASSTTMKAND